MQGAVAAGNRHSADAGAWALSLGGMAIDAIVAATLAAFVAEGQLTGPAGGGLLLVTEAGGEPTVLDCLFNVPFGPRRAMDEIVVDFGDASTQVFHVGEASAAVPGLVAGLVEAHGRYGRLPWADLFEPALELAHAGVELSAAQRMLATILIPILERTDEGRSIYGSRKRVETRSMLPGLERLRDEGAAAVAALVPALADDVHAYEVMERRPLETAFRGARIVTSPAPSLGGEIVARGLAELERLQPTEGRPLAADLVAAIRAGYGGGALLAPLVGTTNVSVIDREGNAAVLSSTLGTGAGVFASGFQLNNMLGEVDLVGIEARDPGSRLPSLMAPTLVLEAGAPRLVIGSAGSLRIPGAILQVIHHVVADALPIAAAIAHPRVHVESGVAQLEGGWPEEAAEYLQQEGQGVNAWAATNLYFGGVSAVERPRAGELAAAGDPRRGGHGVVLP